MYELIDHLFLNRTKCTSVSFWVWKEVRKTKQQRGHILHLDLFRRSPGMLLVLPSCDVFSCGTRCECEGWILSVSLETAGSGDYVWLCFGLTFFVGAAWDHHWQSTLFQEGPVSSWWVRHSVGGVGGAGLQDIIQILRGAFWAFLQL